MRARFKGPAGTGVVEINDDASVHSLFDKIRSKTGIQSFTIKYGLPMAMKTLDSSHLHQNARALGLHGGTLTIVPNEGRPVSPISKVPISPAAKQQTHGLPRQPRTQPDEQPEDINIPWPEREGTLCEYPTLGTVAIVPLFTNSST